MNTLYLICSHSCLSQMEVPYLLNNSPMLHGESQAGEHWASYELDGKEVDHEPGPLGKIRVHDDYWNISDEDREWYNYDIRNTMEISTEQLDGLLNLIKDKDDLKSVAAFSMIEGAVLYSSFAFLKHFQSNGKNQILNTVRGINFSVRDENLHCIGGAYAYNTLKAELFCLTGVKTLCIIE